jgi:sulfonate transport system substrate-binding protein
VLGAYEKAREWSLKNPDQLAQLVATESGLPLDVAKLQLSRTDISNPRLTDQDIIASKGAAPILVSEELVRRGADVGQVIDQLIDPSYDDAVVAKP